MNTNDKTLADVQPGGRVRLGDALLPCPFCGNDAEFVSYKNNGLTLKCKSMGCIQRNQRTLRYGIDWLRTSMAEHWNTRALSAHPSTGGQGDALLEEVARFLDYSVGHDPWPNIRRAYGDAWWEPVRKMRDDLRALAARQPVGQEPLWCLHVLGMDDVHPAPSKAHAEKAAAWHNEQFKDQAARLGISIEAKVVPWPHSAESHAAGVAAFIPQWLVPQWQLDALESTAARQPVDEVSVKKEDANNYCLILRALGMEEEGDPVAEVQALIEARDRQPVGEPVAVVTTSDRFTYGKLNRDLPDGTHLYAAPTAQAVDLGPVRDVFRRWHANELNSTDAMLALVEALAVIDSQAVGNG